MKISFIISDYNYHGGAKKTANLAEHLQLLGHKIEIIVLRSREGDHETRPKNFSNIIDLNSKGFIMSIIGLIKIFKKQQEHNFICIGTISNIAAGLAKLLSRNEILLIGSENFAKSILIGDFPKPYLKLLLPFFRLAYKQLNGLMFVSENLKLEFLKKNSWHPSRCFTIYNPVRSIKVIQKKPMKKNENKGLNFLGVGVLEHRKRFDLLLKAFANVAKDKDILFIAGTGSLNFELRRLAKDLEIESKVRFLGYVAKIDLLMQNSDILVLTSDSEAFGMVLVEGLQAGLQVVSTNSFSGPAEILDNGRYGFLAEVDDVNSIINAMNKAITNPIPQEILKQGVSRFSIDNICNKYIEFLSKVKKRKGNLYDCL